MNESQEYVNREPDGMEKYHDAASYHPSEARLDI